MTSNIFLTVIIPAFNEENRLPSTLKRIHSYLSSQAIQNEILVIDDASTDQTRDRVKDHMLRDINCRLIRHLENKGKGACIKTGILLAKGKYVLFSDADLSTPIEEVSNMLKQMETYHVIIASRRLKTSNLTQRQPFYREMSGRIFSVLVRMFILNGFLDTQCGFKLFRTENAKTIFSRMTIDRFGFDVEALFIAVKKLNLNVLEFPVTWTDSRPTKVHLIKDSVSMFFDLLRIRFHDLCGKYDVPHGLVNGSVRHDS